MTDFVPMIPADNPLVALATTLGYTIFIDIRPFPAGTSSPRYRGDLPKGIHYYNNDLLRLLTMMIQDDHASSHLTQQLSPSTQQDQHDEQAEIEQLERTIQDLKRQLDLEHRYLIDTQARGFLSFLKRQPVTPFIQKLLDDQFLSLHNQAARWTYEVHLRQKHYSDEELEEFKNLWKVLLLETLRNDF